MRNLDDDARVCVTIYRLIPILPEPSTVSSVRIMLIDGKTYTFLNVRLFVDDVGRYIFKLAYSSIRDLYHSKKALILRRSTSKLPPVTFVEPTSRNSQNPS